MILMAKPDKVLPTIDTTLPNVMMVKSRVHNVDGVLKTLLSRRTIRLENPLFRGILSLLGSPVQGELSAARLTEGLTRSHIPDTSLGVHQSLRHGYAVPPPFTQGRHWCSIPNKEGSSHETQ